MIKVCCITYREQIGIVREAIKVLEDREMEISTVEGLRNEILPELRREIAGGLDVIIAGGANAEFIQEQLDFPMIRYQFSEYDMMSIIQQGMNIGKKLGIVTYKVPLSEALRIYLEKLGIVYTNLIYEDTEELEQLIRTSGADIIIGRTHANEVAQQLKIPSLLICPGVESVLQTFHDAKMLAQEIRKNRQKESFFRTAISSSPNGVMLTDAVFTIKMMNRMAETMLGIHSAEACGRSFGEFCEGWNTKKNSADRQPDVVMKIRIRDQNLNLIVAPTEADDRVLIISYQGKEEKLREDHWKREEAERKNRGFSAKRNFSDIIGMSVSIKEAVSEARAYAPSEANVLLTGETGTGKEVFAQSIHNASKRAKGPFVAVNCGAFTETLLESELFGYDEGAFTGSRKGGKKGLFELADGGTLFLDEIGEIAPLMQSKLLRVLQEHEIMRVGGDKIIPVDVRVISATNRDLEHMDHSEFRRDLLYRLNVLELHIPPLRERLGDKVLLFRHFYQIRRSMTLYNVEPKNTADEIVRVYDWPGNIRELQNVCERCCLYLEQLPVLQEKSFQRALIHAIGEDRLVRSIFKYFEYDGKTVRPEMVRLLKSIMLYNRDQIAEQLKCSRTTVWRIMKAEETLPGN